MAWIFFLESAESQSHSNPGCEPSLIVNKTDTLSPYFFQECLKESCTKRLSGMTCKRSLEQCCRQLTLFSEASPARISALREMELAWKESEVVFSSRLSGSQKKFSRLLCSSKTSPQLELADFEKSSEHLPKFGMTVGGRVYLPQALEPLTKENDGSCWLSTPTTENAVRTEDFKRGRLPNPQEYILMYPTPTAQTYGTQKKNGPAGYRPSLETMARKNLWPTPCARDWKDSPNQKYRGKRDDTKPSMQVYSQNNSGQLNPQWVEWLMGYHTDHTELSALGIAWFRNK